jgi:diguanylate cyclase (GGDEF)-like protein
MNLSPRQLNAARLRPFIAVTGVALLLACPLGGDGHTWLMYGLSCLAMATVGVTATIAPARGDGWLRCVRALVYLLGVGLLREATGGASGGVGILVLVPVVWVSLYGTPRMLRLTLAGVGLTYILPLVLIGAPRYPAAGWRSTVLSLALAAIIGNTVQRLVAKTRDQARLDGLTGAANRRSWDERLAAATGVGGVVSIVLIDLDRFKDLNDTQGHEAGDRLLKASVAAWSAQLRPDDLLARVGGDEFAILLPGCTLAQAQAVADRVHEAAPGRCSVGAAEWDGQESPERLQRRADELLYAQKRSTATPPGSPPPASPQPAGTSAASADSREM